MRRFVLLLATLTLALTSGPAWAVADEPIPPTYPFPAGTDINKLTPAQQKVHFKWVFENEKYQNRRDQARIMREVKLAEEKERQERLKKTPQIYPDE